MYIKKIKLENFRNYNSLELEVSPGVNVIFGKNGQGKTNILEAMILCAIGKSFRTSKETDLIQLGSEKYTVDVEIEENIARFIKVEYNNKKTKVLRIDGSCIPKFRFLMGKFLGVMFSPEDINLVSEGPLCRRKFLNVALCQLSSDYYYNLSMYNKTLKEKNTYLSGIGAKDEMMLDVYNDALAEYGSKIVFERAVYIERMNVLAEKRHSEITGASEEKLSFKYCTDTNLLANVDISIDADLKYTGTEEKSCVDKIKTSLRNSLNDPKIHAKEIQRCTSLIGPHHDDFDIYIGNMSVKNFGSQGQKRTAVISIKLAELDIVKMTTGRTPVLFLDDVMSELDENRRRMLTECIHNVQTFISCTEKETVGRFNHETGVNFIDASLLR